MTSAWKTRMWIAGPALALLCALVTAWTAPASAQLRAKHQYDAMVLRMTLDPDFRNMAMLRLLGDYEGAAEIARQQAAKGRHEFQVMLGEMHENGLGARRSYRQAAALYEQAIEGGSVYAAFHLAYLKRHGFGTERDIDEAIRLSELAANNGVTFARLNLGQWFSLGNLVERDRLKAVQWFRGWEGPRPLDNYRLTMQVRRAELLAAIGREDLETLTTTEGDLDAAHELAKRHMMGRYGEPNLEQALVIWSQTAKSGHAPSAHAIGIIQGRGMGRPANPMEAFAWIGLALRQDRFHPVAPRWVEDQEFFAKSLTEQQKARANELIDALARPAEERLRQVRDVHLWGAVDLETAAVALMLRDYPRARAVLARVAAEGPTEAKLALGVMLENHYQDVAAARTWYELAALEGNAEAAFQVALLDLAQTYDTKAANEWLAMAVESGHVPAKALMGVHYIGGAGVGRDRERGMEMLKDAARQGDPYAALQIGFHHFNGEQLRKSRTEALRWWRLSAQQGYNPAYHAIANSYFKGWGVSRDYVEAYRWTRLAESQSPTADDADEIFGMSTLLAAAEGEADLLRDLAALRAHLEEEMTEEEIAAGDALLVSEEGFMDADPPRLSE